MARKRTMFIALLALFLVILTTGTGGADTDFLTVVSSVGDSVSTSPTGPFTPATFAYVAGRPRRDDGGTYNYVRIEGAYWIWMDDFIGDLNNPLYFPKTFLIPEEASDITGTMEITADNYFNFSINGVDYGGAFPPEWHVQWDHIHPYSITNLVPGENHLFATAWEAHPGKPSGLVYKLTITYQLHADIEVSLDIKPQSCPNPLNTKSKGVLPVAILGTQDFDVTQVDVATVQLEGVAPSDSNWEDVATPFFPLTGKENCSDCTDDGPDGFTDLTLKFDTQEIVAALGGVTDGECLVLTLAGNLMEGTGGNSIAGEDVVVILKKGNATPGPEQPCEPVMGIPKTGQTISYYPGDDGALQMGVPWPDPRFTDNGDGTVRDDLTGLIWLQEANCISAYYPGFDNEGEPGDGRVSWEHALDFVDGVNNGIYPDCGGGYTDWRLPNIRELLSLIDYGQNAPALTAGHPFTNVQAAHYWSSTMSAGGATVWTAYFGGGAGTWDPSHFFPAWYVRGPDAVN